MCLVISPDDEKYSMLLQRYLRSSGERPNTPSGSGYIALKSPEAGERLRSAPRLRMMMEATRLASHVYLPAAASARSCIF